MHFVVVFLSLVPHLTSNSLTSGQLCTPWQKQQMQFQNMSNLDKSVAQFDAIFDTKQDTTSLNVPETFVFDSNVNYGNTYRLYIQVCAPIIFYIFSNGPFSLTICCLAIKTVMKMLKVWMTTIASLDLSIVTVRKYEENGVFAVIFSKIRPCLKNQSQEIVVEHTSTIVH